ncbi:MAG: hypothetical protein ACOCUO_01525 [archaeon]
MPTRGIREYSTSADILEYEEVATEEAIEALASFRSKVSADDTDDIVVRGAIVEEDMDVNEETLDDAVVDNENPVWETTTGSDESGDWYGWYAFDSNENMDDKAAVMYGFQHLDPDEGTDLQLSAVRLRNKNGGLIDEVDLSSIDVADDKILLYDDPLVVADDDTYLEIYVEDGGEDATHLLKPLVKVAELSKETFDESTRFVRN